METPDPEILEELGEIFRKEPYKMDKTKEKRVLHLVISSCEDCPYCQYNADYSMSYDSGYDCNHDEGNVGRIADSWQIHNDNNKKPKVWPPIPDGCPLPKEK